MTSKSQRIVFRHCQKTVECYTVETDPGWMCSVQGEKNPRGPFTTPGEAVSEGIAVASQQHHVRARMKDKKVRARVATIKHPTLASILRKAEK
jgi:hypothetical protein